jgi:hypothetical protein
MLLALAPSVRSVATSAHTATSQVVELREKEEAEEEEAKAAAKAAEAAALMREANLEGVDTLFDDMTAGDEEWAAAPRCMHVAHAYPNHSARSVAGAPMVLCAGRMGGVAVAGADTCMWCMHAKITVFAVWLLQVPTLLDAWGEARDRFEVERDNFKAAALEKHAAKAAELTEWQAIVRKKHVVRDVRVEPSLAPERVAHAQVRR